jgi:orotidine-5'-phosphate decarboxylase
MKDWPKLILALDVPLDEMDKVFAEVGSLIPCFKVGLNMITSPHLTEVVQKAKQGGARIFLDGKLHDIPNTVANSVRSLTGLGADFFTVHTSGGRAMMKAAKDAAEERAAELNISPAPFPVGVTVLTSMKQETWQALFQTQAKVEDQVLHFVEEALEAGLNAVVASPLEVEAIRSRFGKEVRIITPGIRPAWAAKGDQARIATPKATMDKGASSLVIGRPILFPPETVGSRKRAVEMIAEEIGGL